MKRERPTLLSFVPVYRHMLLFPVCFPRWVFRISTYFLTPSRKVWLRQRYFSGCLKMHKKFLSKEMMLSVDAPPSSLSVSQTSSNIRFGDRNPALLCTDFADCWLRNKYSLWLIIRKLGQVVTHWNVILFQLVYGSSIYRSVCLFLCVKLQLKL